MLLAQDPVTKLWCREDGKVLMPPCPVCRAPRHTYEWAAGCPFGKLGYLVIRHQHKNHKVHRIIARAFLPNPDGLPTVDHIDRNPKNNRVENLRWASRKMQNNNRQVCEDSKTKYGVRACEDKKAYYSAYHKAHDVAQKGKGLVRRKHRWVKP